MSTIWSLLIVVSFAGTHTAANATSFAVSVGGFGAAATAVVYEDEAGGGDGDQLVRIDRAFFLMIRDRPSDQLLFFGRVLDPTGGGE